jgi:hypothetical protein
MGKARNGGGLCVCLRRDMVQDWRLQKNNEWGYSDRPTSGRNLHEYRPFLGKDQKRFRSMALGSGVRRYRP